MASVRPTAPEAPPVAGGPAAFRPVLLDEDDGIHLASVRRVAGPDGVVLRAVVSWFEDGRWVEKTLDLPESPEPPASGSLRRRRAGSPPPAEPGALPTRAGAAGPDDVLLFYGVRATAERLGISERTLRRRFARQGTRIHDHRDALRRERALDLLGGELPMSTVAVRLGFTSSQTFARYVRQAFGRTATEVRRGLRGGAAALDRATLSGRKT